MLTISRVIMFTSRVRVLSISRTIVLGLMSRVKSAYYKQDDGARANEQGKVLSISRMIVLVFMSRVKSA